VIKSSGFWRAFAVFSSFCFLLSFLPAISFSAAGEKSVKVIVPADASPALLKQAGAKLVADRSSYRVYEVSAERASSLSGALPRPDFDRIELNRAVLDTTVALPAVPPSLTAAENADGLMLVQFSAPPLDADIALISKAGAEIVQYVPQNAYIIWVPASAAPAVARAASASPVQYYGPYHPWYALSPRLDKAEGETMVTVQFYNYGEGARSAAEKIAAGSVKTLQGPKEALGGHYINVRVSVAASSLSSLASLPGVVTVEPYVEPKLLCERQDQTMARNLNPGETGPSAPGYLSFLSSLSFPTDPAEYSIIDIVDDGFDTGNAASPGNSEFRELNNAGLPSRVAYAIIAAGASGFTPEGADGHGNINCSIVGGYNDGAGSPANVDSQGYHWGLGVSPYGRIASTKIFGPSGWSYPDEDLMVSNQYAAGVRATSNSWGADNAGAYDIDSQAYDRRTRDAQSGTAGNQEMLFVFAAGNAGSGSSSVGTPATAKNVIAVGASENNDAVLSYTDGCGVGVSGSDNIQDIIDFSSRGPCLDSRFKPEIVAPGTHIHGAASYDASYNGSGVCDQYNPVGQIKYAESSGTSHSTPAISGFVSLVTNFLSRVYEFASPSPALKKAYVVHCAHFMTGVDANDNLPSNNQGFGIADLSLAFNTDAERYLLDQTELFTASGQSFSVEGALDQPGQVFRAALVWTDPPGATSGNAYINDLDLEVTINGTLYRGNNFTNGVSQTGGAADVRNNTECVFLPAGTTGNVTITVKATTIAGDGVPANGDATDQDFALVVYNFDTTPWQYLIDEGFDGFQTGTRPAGWVFTNCNDDTDTYTEVGGYYGRALPSVKLDATGDIIETVTFTHPRDLSFWVRGVSVGVTGSLLVEEFYSGSYYLLADLTDIPPTGTVEGRYPLNDGTSKIRFTYTKDSGDIGLDDVRVAEGITPTPTMTPTPSCTPFGYKTPTPTATPTVTPTPRVFSPPYTENFETDWEGWTTEYVTGTEPWYQAEGTAYSDGIPAAAYEGTYNAYFFYLDEAVKSTRLISPRIVFPVGSTNARLTFYHAQAGFETYLDTMAVYYRSSYGGAWQQLANYPSAVNSWTQRTISLPDLSQDYYISFLPSTTWAYGVCVDLVQVSLITTPSPVQKTPTPSPTPIGYKTPPTSPTPQAAPTPSCGPNRTPATFLVADGDYNGDGTAEMSVFRSSYGLWAIRALTRAFFGAAGDLPASGDFNGDGTTEMAVFRSYYGLWSVRGFTRAYFGGSSDFPAPGDYDGDGIDDIAVFRGSENRWAIRDLTRIFFGATGDRPVPADWQGDGAWVVGIYRPPAGMWSVRNVSRFYIGGSEDWALPADYNGDGTADAGIFRSRLGLWAIPDFTRMYYGGCRDWPVPADYDGMGFPSIGVFKDCTGLWAIPGVTRAYHGTCGDLPVAK
jgi:hypothetical protein